MNNLTNTLQIQLKEKKFLQRLAVYILGLLLCAAGVAFSINSQLGISPMNSFPYIISLIIGFDLGMTVIVFMVILVFLQFLILGKNFKWINVTQIIFATIFGYFVDFTRFILGDFTFPTYIGQLVMMAISFTLIGTGITLYVSAKLVPLPFEGIVLAIAEKTRWRFPRVMIGTHSLVVTVGVILSFTFLGGLYGVREGTIMAALMVGKMVAISRGMLQPFLKNLDTSNSIPEETTEIVTE